MGPTEGLQGFAWIGRRQIFFCYFFGKRFFAQKIVKNLLDSLHLVFCKPFCRLQTQLSPTEAGLKSTFNVALNGPIRCSLIQLVQPLPMML